MLAGRLILGLHMILVHNQSKVFGPFSGAKMVTQLMDYMARGVAFQVKMSQVLVTTRMKNYV